MKYLSYILPILILSLFSCGEDGAEKTDTIQSRDSDHKTLEITVDQYQMGKMDTGRISMQPFNQVIQTTGTLDVPPNALAFVSAYFGGYVQSLNLIPGERVKKGQTLFQLENPDFIEIQQDYLTAANQLAYLQKEYKRQEELIQDNYTSEKNFLKAQSDYLVRRSEYGALKKKLGMMGIDTENLTDTNIHSSIAIRAPISGVVQDVKATRGMFLSPADVAVSIINTEHIHVELMVYETDLGKITIGQPVEFRLQSQPEKIYLAEVYLIDPSIHTENRNVRVHCHLKDEKNVAHLTPGMFVEAEIYTQQDSLPALPEKAVVQSDDKSYVLLLEHKKDERFVFTQREIQTGPLYKGYYALLNAEIFDPNAVFLVKGGFGLIQD